MGETDDMTKHDIMTDGIHGALFFSGVVSFKSTPRVGPTQAPLPSHLSSPSSNHKAVTAPPAEAGARQQRAQLCDGEDRKIDEEKKKCGR